MDPRIVVGQNIRQARHRLGLTQEALADISETSVQQVSRAERGAHDLRVSTVKRFATALDTTASDLLRGV